MSHIQPHSQDTTSTDRAIRVNLIEQRRFIAHDSLADYFGQEASVLSDSVQRYFDVNTGNIHLYEADFQIDPTTETLWISRAGVVFLSQRFPGDMIDWRGLERVKQYLGCPHGTGVVDCELVECVCGVAM